MAITRFGVSTDGAVFVPASECLGFVGTWTQTRNAGGDYSINLTAAANSPFLAIPLINTGLLLAGYDVIYSIATANLTTHTGTLYQTTYVAGAASSVATKQTAQALGTTITTNINVAHVTLATPYDVGVNTDIEDWLEIAVVNPGTSVYKFYGVTLYGARDI